VFGSLNWFKYIGIYHNSFAFYVDPSEFFACEVNFYI
jgi:hypothetical protein